MDHVRPGVVEWGKVNKAPKMVFKKIENMNYAVDLGSGPFKFSLVGVQGNDLVEGKKKLTLALIWQLMRCHLVGFLETLRKAKGAGGELTDAEIIRWSNETVAAAGVACRIKDFHDKTLSTSLFLLELLAAVEPRCVDRQYVTEGASEEERRDNAKYAISCARKLGCSLFLLWEDIVEVRPKMMLSFVAAVMAFALDRPGAAPAGAIDAD